jgi:flagellar biosynthetic protein FlhB
MAESGEKRHAPTPKRLRQAAERGDVRRSGDLPKAAVAVAITTLVFAGAAGVGAKLPAFCALWLTQAGTSPSSAALGWAGQLALQILPLLALAAAVSAGASIVFGGLVFSLTPLKPDLSKLLPSHGLGQLFAPTNFSETIKAALKFVAIGGTGALAILARGPAFASLSRWTEPNAGPALAITLQVLLAICAALALLAGADMALQAWLHRQRLRMTDTELRDELKDAAGNPQTRQRQRMLARKLARARQMGRIPEASVVVTNPTHFAVAIRYRRGADRAPMLLAKGVGMLAEEIIAKARGLGIPVVEAPPLARAVYRHVEPGEHVPVPLYRACAEVLAYVWRMQRWRAQGGPRPAPPPVRDGEIEVPRFAG